MIISTQRFVAIPHTHSSMTAQVTGANSGIGYEASLKMVQAGANVILAVRNPEKGEECAFCLLELNSVP